MEPVTEPVETPEDWEPEQCYCIGIERPPCSWCTSPGGDPDREEEPAPPAVIFTRDRVPPAQLTITLTISRGEPRNFGWSQAKPLVPTHAAVTWASSQPGSPTGWRFQGVRVTGAPVKRDGTLSQNVSTHSLWREHLEQPWAQAIVAAAQEELEYLLQTCTCTVAAESDGESGYIADLDAGCPEHGTRAGWRQGHEAWWRLAEATTAALFPKQTGPFDAPPVEDTLHKLVKVEAAWRATVAAGGGPVEQYDNPATGDRTIGDVRLVEQYEHVAGLTYPERMARLTEQMRQLAARVDQVAEDLSGLSISEQYASELDAIAAALRQGPEA